MNAALASGEAGVGEMRPARSPMRPRQFGVALAAAAVGGGLGMFTYHAVAGSQTSYAGQVAPAHTYYLDFPAEGTVLTLAVQPGSHVHKGEVLATQDSSVAQANLSAAQAAVAADQAVVAADESPQAGASQQAADQLSVTQADAAVGAAQNALSLQQNSAQHTVAAQTTVVNNAQTAYDTDSARYAAECANQPSSTAPTTAAPTAPTAPTTPAAPEGTDSPLTRQSTPPAGTAGAAAPQATAVAAQPAAGGHAASPAGTAGASGPTASAAQEQFCQNLQSTIDHDLTDLSSAQAELASLQSSTQLQEQHDESALTQSQAVLGAAETRQSAAGAPLTPDVIAQAKANLANAQAQVASDQLALQNTRIIAPADGTVADTAGAPGDIVGPNGVHGYQGPAEQSGTQQDQQPGFELFVPQSNGASGANTAQSSYMPLITLYTGTPVVVAQIPETDMSSVHAGTAATVDISALNLSVAGRVKSMQLDPVRSSSSTTYYDVTFTLDAKDDRIMDGMSVQVSLD